MNNNNLTKENKRKATVLLIFGALVLIVLVAGSTYAYFRAQVGNGTSANINATTGTVDDLRFEKGADITFEANMTNFAEGKGNVSGSTTSKAILTANDATNSAKEDYYVYVNIITNEIEYTSYKKDTEIKVFKTKEEKEKEVNTLEGYTARPELILSIKGPDDKIVGSDDSLYQIADLTYYDNIITKVNGSDEGQTVSGYDITETTGLIKIELKEKSGLGEGYNYSAHIETDAGNNTNGKMPYQTTQEWEVKVTFINLDSDQNLNTNKSFEGNVILQKEEKILTLAELCKNKELASCLIANKDLDKTLIHHDGTIKTPEVISNLNDETIINGYKLTDDYKDDYIALYASSSSDDLNQNYLIRVYCSGEEKYVGYNCSNSYYTLSFDTSDPKIQYPTYKAALQQAINERYVEPDLIDAGDDSYRYSGANYKIANSYVNDYDALDADSSSDDLSQNYLIRFNCNGEEQYVGFYCKYRDEYSKVRDYPQYYYLDYDKGEEKKQYNSFEEAANQAIKDGYLVPAVNNYVCLDGTTGSGKCTGTKINEDANLYRIIGLFKNGEQYEIKLIKDTIATTNELGDKNYKISEEDPTLSAASISGTCYYWNQSTGVYSNDNVSMWKESNLNKVNLNNFYYNYITSKVKGLANYIADHTWIVGNNYNYKYNIYNDIAKYVYDNDIGEKRLNEESEDCYNQRSSIKRKCDQPNDLTYQAHIGLMYISDYMYGTIVTNWDKSVSYYSQDEVKNNNWLYIGTAEWTISRSSSDIGAYTVDIEANGWIISHNVNGDYTIRPTFYLTSDTKLASGKGTLEEPYRLKLS